MFKFFHKRKVAETAKVLSVDEATTHHGLRAMGRRFFAGLAQLFTGSQQVQAELLRNLEAQLLSFDLGVTLTQEVLARLQVKLKEQRGLDYSLARETLQEVLSAILVPCESPLVMGAYKPMVVLCVGVNGVGKTTTLGKLAALLKNQGLRVLLAAGDTFRAAAIEQLKIWGERDGVPVIAQNPGADSAAVIYDALQSAQARNFDVLLADTAGRLHTHDGLMEELKKVKRVLQKLDPSAPHEVLLVLDATIGQNSVVQARQFTEALGVTGLVITKLDGTAKGGAIFAIAQSLHIPIRFIGVGEKLEDLQEFKAKEFIETLFGVEHVNEK